MDPTTTPTDASTVVTEFINFKCEEQIPYMEVWVYDMERADSEYVKSPRLTYTEEELKDPIIAWCLTHAPFFQSGNRESIAEFVKSEFGSWLPFWLGLKIVETLANMLPYSGKDTRYYYTPEIEFFHQGSPVTINCTSEERILEELKALSTKKEED